MIFSKSKEEKINDIHSKARKKLFEVRDCLEEIRKNYGEEDLLTVIDSLMHSSGFFSLMKKRIKALDEISQFEDRITRNVYYILSVHHTSKDEWIKDLDKAIEDLIDTFYTCKDVITVKDVEDAIINDTLEYYDRVDIMFSLIGSSETEYTDKELQTKSSEILKKISKYCTSDLKYSFNDILYSSVEDFKKINNLTDEDLTIMKLQGRHIPGLK